MEENPCETMEATIRHMNEKNRDLSDLEWMEELYK